MDKGTQVRVDLSFTRPSRSLYDENQERIDSPNINKYFENLDNKD